MHTHKQAKCSSQSPLVYSCSRNCLTFFYLNPMVIKDRLDWLEQAPSPQTMRGRTPTQNLLFMSLSHCETLLAIHGERVTRALFVGKAHHWWQVMYKYTSWDNPATSKKGSANTVLHNQQKFSIEWAAARMGLPDATCAVALWSCWTVLQPLTSACT